jgi:hypothetical protein
LLAALALYGGLPDTLTVSGKPEESNQNTSEQETATEKEKQSDK